MKICLVSSEVAPLAKTGGLADVVAGLGRYLESNGHDVRIFMPLYGRISRDEFPFETVDAATSVTLDLGKEKFEFALRRTKLPNSESLPVYGIDCPQLFHREELYGSYADEHVRFGLLNRAVLESCQRLQWAPDVFHLNDWHTGLLPLYLKTLYAWDDLFRHAKTLLTIHNIGYQGTFPTDALADLGLEKYATLFHQGDYRDGFVNFLKTGMIYSDWLTTVSETYAKEIQTSDYGMGLEDVLVQRAGALTGIVNGVDYGDWNPEIDPLIRHHYTADDLTGKPKNKAELIKAFELEIDANAPLFGSVSRLTGQKGFELLPDILPILLRQENMGLVILGSGEEKYEKYFQWLRDKFPTKVGIFRGYNNELAHKIEAGADMFLMPSRYEPCGLNQMYSLKYGTAPIVRRTGGLADTVVPFNPRTGEGTGFVFERFDVDELHREMRRALEVWQDRNAWARLVQNGMAQDFSWQRQGPRYENLYSGLHA
ncbi:MAG: glycogen synthase GlgA [Planctomycetes bacterium]|nr:glycogen synthase GlgA [Planctomycetota bacterium]